MISMALERLLEHDVEMFGLDPELIWRVIQAFVKHCDQFSAERGDIQIASPSEFDTFRSASPYTVHLVMDDPERMERALTELLRRPRILKHALRRTWIAWESLHGEVSLVDLLVYSAVHTVSADAVAFIREHWSPLASGPESKLSGEAKNDPEASWNAHMSRYSDGEKKNLWVLTKFLFPVLGHMQRRPRAQGADKERYWDRIVNRRIQDNAVPDQEVLRDVLHWRSSGDPSRLLKGLLDSAAYTSTLAEFYESPKQKDINLNGDDILDLATHLFDMILEREGKNARADSCPGFIGLWRLEIRRDRFEDYEGWLWRAIQKAMPVSLHLATGLEHYWGGSDSPMDTDREARTRLRCRVAAWAKANLNAELFCRVLPSEAPHVLLSFVLGPHRDTKAPEPDWNTWSWIAKVLLEALVRDPSIMIPQVIVVFVQSDRRLPDPRFEDDEDMESQRKVEIVYQLRRDRVRGLFTSAKLRRQFADSILQPATDEESWAPDTQIMVTQVREDISAWQGENDLN